MPTKTKTPVPARTSLFPRTTSEAAADALARATAASARVRGDCAVASLTAAGRKAEAKYPHLRAAARAPKTARCLGPALPISELYGGALATE